GHEVDARAAVFAAGEQPVVGGAAGEQQRCGYQRFHGSSRPASRPPPFGLTQADTDAGCGPPKIPNATLASAPAPATQNSANEMERSRFPVATYWLASDSVSGCVALALRTL